MTRACRKSGVWAALLAVALNVLWPLIAAAEPRAAMPREHTEHAEAAVTGHCDSVPGGAPNNGHGLPHCGFCTFIGDKAPVFAPAGMANAGILRLELAAFPDHLSPHPQPGLYSPAQPRAPPALS